MGLNMQGAKYTKTNLSIHSLTQLAFLSSIAFILRPIVLEWWASGSCKCELFMYQ